MSYSVVKTGLVSLATVAINALANKSRQRSNVELMTHCGEHVDNDFRDLSTDLVGGFDAASHGSLILTPITSKAYQDLVGIDGKKLGDHFKGLRTQMREAFKAVSLSKAGTFKAETGSALETALTGKPVNNDSITKAFDKQGSPGSKDLLCIPVSGNRRVVAIPFADAIRLHQGDAPIDKVQAEIREYTDAGALLRDIIRLNENRKRGVKPTSDNEKVAGAFAAWDRGMDRSSYSGANGLYPDLKAGKKQQIWEPVVVYFLLTLVDEDLAEAWRAWNLDRSKAVLSQPQVTALRKDFRMACCHRDGDPSKKESFLGKGKKANLMLVRDHIEAHPKAQSITALVGRVKQIMEGKVEGAPRTKAMAKADMEKIAAKVSKNSPARALIQAFLSNDSADATKAVEAIDSLAPKVFPRDSNWELGTKHLTQRTVDLYFEKGVKKVKKPSGRQLKSG